MYKHFGKRVIDFIFALIVLIILFIPLLIITIWLHFANKGAGAFFFQERPGKNEKIFKICKFKSMTDELDKDGNLLPDAQRLTKVGYFVRITSIDELPQLWNVLKGDMSLIGPRPLLSRYLGYYTERERLRHSVRPAIPAFGHTHGRNCGKWDNTLANDVWYVENMSIGLDLKIFFLTIKKVFIKEDIDVAPCGDFLDVERSRNGKHLDKQ